MKLTAIKLLGRFRHIGDGRCANIRRGRNAARGTEHYFYLYRRKHIPISDREFFHEWKPSPEKFR